MLQDEYSQTVDLTSQGRKIIHIGDDARHQPNQPIEAGNDPGASFSASPPERDQLGTPSDWHLLERIAADDDLAMRLFYRRYSGLVYSLAWHMLGNQTQAEDILQETFIHVWRAAITFDPARGQVESWVVTIARNLILTLLRKQRAASLEDYFDEVSALADDRNNPEQTAIMNSRQQVVREAVAKLPKAQQQVVLLAYFGGLTHVEIADKTGEPLGTVKSRLRLAIRRLQTLLHPVLGETGDD